MISKSRYIIPLEKWCVTDDGNEIIFKIEPQDRSLTLNTPHAVHFFDTEKEVDKYISDNNLIPIVY